MGSHPSKSRYVSAIMVWRSISRSTWEKKLSVYRLGLSEALNLNVLSIIPCFHSLNWFVFPLHNVVSFILSQTPTSVLDLWYALILIEDFWWWQVLSTTTGFPPKWWGYRGGRPLRFNSHSFWSLLSLNLPAFFCAIYKTIPLP